VLSELGWIGLTLFVAAIALFVVAAFRRLTRDRGDPERPLLAALQAGVLAFVVHISWDWDWDMAVAGSVFFLFAAVSAAFLTTRGNDLADARRAAEGRGREPGGAAGAAVVRVAVPAADAVAVEAEAAAAGAGAAGHASGVERETVVEGETVVEVGTFTEAGTEQSPARAEHPSAADDDSGSRRHARPSYAPLPVRVALSGLALLAALSWLPPYLGERAAVRAVSAAGAGELALAAREAETGRARNPLAVRPLITLALVQQQLGQGRAALATLDEAAALQPQNADVHYQRGLVLLNALGRPAEAAEAFVRALELDPLDDASAFQLSRALQRVGAGGT
jgi:cytochrome c-type biogenesis protein CcmH/NrfG